jgi:integrase
MNQKDIAAALRRRGEKRVEVWDDQVKGLVLRVDRTTASWWFQYRPKGATPEGKRWPNRKIRVGEVSTMSLDEARIAAGRHREAWRQGGDPAREKAAELVARVEGRRVQRIVGEALDEYALFLRGRNTSDRHKHDEEQQARKAVEIACIHDLPLRDVSRRHVMAILDGAKGPALPRKLLGAFGRFLSWARDREMIDHNPVLDIDRRRRPKPPPPRTRALSLAEARRVWIAAGAVRPGLRKGEAGAGFGDGAGWTRIARFALLVPARINEISAMTWGDVDLDKAVWTMPGRKTKNGDDFALPLPAPVVEILKEQREVRRGAHEMVGAHEPVFMGNRLGRRFAAWPHLMRALQEACGVRSWGWHDIRRSVVSQLAEHGVSESVADSLLNHRQSATRGGVLGVYQRSTRRQERRAALDLWARLLTQGTIMAGLLPLCVPVS